MQQTAPILMLQTAQTGLLKSFLPAGMQVLIQMLQQQILMGIQELALMILELTKFNTTSGKQQLLLQIGVLPVIGIREFLRPLRILLFQLAHQIILPVLLHKILQSVQAMVWY